MFRFAVCSLNGRPGYRRGQRLSRGSSRRKRPNKHREVRPIASTSGLIRREVLYSRDSRGRYPTVFAAVVEELLWKPHWLFKNAIFFPSWNTFPGLWKLSSHHFTLHPDCILTWIIGQTYQANDMRSLRYYLSGTYTYTFCLNQIRKTVVFRKLLNLMKFLYFSL